MIILVSGSSCVGKTNFAQKLLEKYKYPYLSIDHLKMGLIRSKETNLNVYDDEALKEYLWPIIIEMIKTAIENKQNLIVEGVYIPFDFKDDFLDEYLKCIKHISLIMSESYIKNNIDLINRKASSIEDRQTNNVCELEQLLKDNQHQLDKCKELDLDYVLIESDYEKTINEYINTLEI